MAHCRPSQTDADGAARDAALAKQGLEGNEQLEIETAQIDVTDDRH